MNEQLQREITKLGFKLGGNLALSILGNKAPDEENSHPGEKSPNRGQVFEIAAFSLQ